MNSWLVPGVLEDLTVVYILDNLISFVLSLPCSWRSVPSDLKPSKATVIYHLQVYLHFLISPGRLKMLMKKLVWKNNKPHFYLWHPEFAAEYLISFRISLSTEFGLCVSVDK